MNKTSYTVSEIAEMLKTNEETVRRWIRTNRLEAIQPSKRQGNIISESAFGAFLEDNPKYKEVYKEGSFENIAKNIALDLLTGLPIFTITSIVKRAARDKDDDENPEDVLVDSTNVERLLNEEILEHRAVLEKINNEKAVIEKQIKDEEDIIERLEDLFEKITERSDANE